MFRRTNPGQPPQPATAVSIPAEDEELGRQGVPFKPFRLGGWLDLVTSQVNGWAMLLETRGVLAVYPPDGGSPSGPPMVDLRRLPSGTWVWLQRGSERFPIAVLATPQGALWAQWLPEDPSPPAPWEPLGPAAPRYGRGRNPGSQAAVSAMRDVGQARRGIRY